MNVEKDNIIETSSINPVDYFNRNHVADMFELMQSVNNVHASSIRSLTYVNNKRDESKHMIVIENDCFVAKMENGLNMQIGDPHTSFMMLQKFVFKNNFNQALYHVMYTFMNLDSDYIRVGYKYFKKITKTDRFGVSRIELKVWDKTIIVDDYGRKFLFDIKKYNDFIVYPDNKSYSSVVGDNYNLYAPFDHKPCNPNKYMGDAQWYWTKTLLEHIFGDQYELGLIYMKVLYDLPKQALPILVLTSEERQTGKSTFVDWINILFGDNSVVINPQDISNSFNSTYADKNIIAIEESRFENVQATEKLKALATQKKISVNTKFIQQYSLPFYGKLIITSNDENKFSKVDNPEIRYWVRKVPSLTGKANHSILTDLKDEIPFFLHHLNTLPEINTTKSRMVFEASEIQTEALKVVKNESKPSLHKELDILFDSHKANNLTIKEFRFTAKDIKEKWFSNNQRIEMSYINRILKTSMKLDKCAMMRYVPLEEQGTSLPKKVSGRPYLIVNEYSQQELKDDSNN